MENVKLSKMKNESSTVIGSHYEPVTKNLYIGFATKQGMVTYRYSKVPSEVAEEFHNADSHGKYFHAHIKDQYETIKL